MKIMHEHIEFPGRSAIRVKWREMPHFTYPWHFHNEFEILYVIDGSGTRFVADSVEKFESGDLVVVGSNLPHFWRSDEKYLNSNEKKKVKYMVIQFPNDFLKDEIASFPEYQLIARLLQNASRGIRFKPGFAKKISPKIIRIYKKTGFERVILLQKLLQVLAKTEEYTLLSGEFYHEQNHNFTNDRLTKVMHFVTTNYRQKIELEKVAAIANMHPSAFCRYFKEKTGKSLSGFISDIRIGYACKLIIEGQLSVSQVCFECGFNNLSNFNRTFKRHTEFTPTQYFQHFHKG